jgi:NADH:ubiquinone oxidoreductase subunit 5 (subunit L)/multisubunit Na+/H+ antiporter MnhA subunit
MHVLTVGVGLTASTAVVAMAARAPLSSSTPVNAASARTPITAVFMLVVGFGAVALGGLMVVMWPGRRRRSDEEPEPVPEPPQLHWAWKVAAVLFPFVLGAALLAAVVFGLGRTRGAAPLSGAGRARPSLGGLVAARGGAQTFQIPSWLPWAVLAIVLTAVIGVAAWLLLRRAQLTTYERSGGSATRAAVQAAIGALDEAGDPRGAVIAAYAAMERALAAHGVARSSAEAPREYLRRVLVASSATEHEARTLTGLFEEARFSIHPISERVREAALSALRSLRARLDRDGPQ